MNCCCLPRRKPRQRYKELSAFYAEDLILLKRYEARERAKQRERKRRAEEGRKKEVLPAKKKR